MSVCYCGRDADDHFHPRVSPQAWAWFLEALTEVRAWRGEADAAMLESLASPPPPP